ncbi:MAG TPA: hypothetical protein PK677_13780 [Acidiphilium sp.]|uniref:hypothetical protein n=1 Tax=unclassified Acidiphilium TaxID=2617493 RepID=UPI000BD2BEFB|nr:MULTISPECIES: hypothetical protein [unclassified Acidiphilium]OYV89005.1 MAG: hypothetical protein B7Z57_14025 [Acidiphilium sp. 37-60-79]OZB22104.1 MAG: hypothetical protein B7X49_17315 [Acidiphilium sp. 34-64-41]HQT89597.1 hypothetical protein [Acidiphilium sp.]
MNRRRTLASLAAGTAAALVAPIAAHAGNPDAELIALCARFDANERRYLSFYSGGANEITDDDERDAVTDPIAYKQRDLAEQITGHRITTLAGFAAVARSLGLWDSQIGEPEKHGCINEQLVAMLVRDGRAMS